MTGTVSNIKKLPNAKSDSASALVREYVANELVLGLVGPVGSGTSTVAKLLQASFPDAKVEILKASDIITQWGETGGRPAPSGETKLQRTIRLQDVGDLMREKDHASVSVHVALEIRAARGRLMGAEPANDEDVVLPDGERRVYIIDSLRNPAEAIFLRSVYQELFCLIGVVCDDEVRHARLKTKYTGATDPEVEQLMKRDALAEQKYGQRVSETFHLADFFVDNTAEKEISGAANPEWTVAEDLGRLADILTRAKIVRPRPNETAMYHAYGARMRSACLSRQVGAALMDRQGNVVATGTNEVPRAGGGVYGGVFSEFSTTQPDPPHDHRCFAKLKHCSNTKEQNEIIDEMLKSVPEFAGIPITPALMKNLRSTRIGQLIEFSRAVHAEMDALLSAARQGISPVGTRLFVTTFPCHNCARHIVSAGVDEVQFIEPYLKSRAIPLHGDSITTQWGKWRPPSLLTDTEQKDAEKSPQVLFRPFVGVAPRLYRRAFYKDQDLKDGLTGKMLETFAPPQGMGSSPALIESYAKVEAELSAKVGKGALG